MTRYIDGVSAVVINERERDITSGVVINLCPNGSFEHWCAGYTSSDNQTPTFWRRYGSPRVVERDEGEWDGFDGCYSVKITGNNTASGRGIWTPVMNLKPSTKYQISSRVQAASGYVCGIHVYSGTAPLRILSPTGVTGVWNTINGEFTTAASGGSIGVSVVLLCAGLSHCAWFDKVVITEGVSQIPEYGYAKPMEFFPVIIDVDRMNTYNNILPYRAILGDVVSTVTFRSSGSMTIDILRSDTISSLLSSSMILGITSSATPQPVYVERGLINPDLQQCESCDRMHAAIIAAGGTGSGLSITMYMR